MNDEEQQPEQSEKTGARVNRAEWGVMVSLLISALTLAFTFGVVYGDVQRNKERISALEPKVDDISARIERIDANVSFLADQAKDERRAR